MKTTPSRKPTKSRAAAATKSKAAAATESKAAAADGLEDANLQDATVNLAKKDKDVADLLAAFHKVSFCCTCSCTHLQHARRM